MVSAMVLLGIVSLVVALTWRQRAKRFTELFIYLEARFDPNTVDLSGKKHYSACISYEWLMKNLIPGPHSRTRKVLHDLVADRTFETTLALGSMIGILPMVVACFLFGSLATVGVSLVVAPVAFVLVQAPMDVDLSYALLTWLKEQDPFLLKAGDLSYALVSYYTIRRWFVILIGATVVSFALAPWSDAILESVVYCVAVAITFFFTEVFVPLAAFNAGLACAVFVVVVVSVATAVVITCGIIYGFVRVGRNVVPLEAKEDTHPREEKPIEEEENTSN